MVRVAGLQYSIAPANTAGSRISDMRLNGKLFEADKSYKVAGWARWLRRRPELTASRCGNCWRLG